MLHRDYILKMVSRLVEVLVPLLDRVRIDADEDSVTQIQQALAELVEMEPSMLFSLAPESFAMMVSLSPQAEGIAPSMVWGLHELACALGDTDEAQLDEERARALAQSHGIAIDVVPDEVRIHIPSRSSRPQASPDGEEGKDC